MPVTCVLVVEDDALLALSLASMLVDAGFCVLGPVATSAGAYNQATQSRPDLALVDIDLRDGKCVGVEVARRLRDEWHAPTLFLSGQEGEAREHRTSALGFLGKPYSWSAVLDSIAVAGAIIDGLALPPLPPGLELFHPN